MFGGGGGATTRHSSNDGFLQTGRREQVACADVVLSLEGITKEFPGVRALVDIGFDLRAGEVHAVCGENGAGKSTLMKIISGVHSPTSGKMVYKGHERRFSSPLEAEQAGIAMIHQELNLVPHLSVAENIFLAREPRRGILVDRAKLRARAERLLRRLDIAIDGDQPVRSLSVAQRQMVEIAKALSHDADVLIMDEPTSSLTEQETRVLFRVIHDLKSAGVGILYISHRLDEMREIVDRVTVLRDGRHVSTDDFADTTVDAIVARMVGRSLDETFPEADRDAVRRDDSLGAGAYPHRQFRGCELRPAARRDSRLRRPDGRGPAPKWRGRSSVRIRSTRVRSLSMGAIWRSGARAARSQPGSPTSRRTGRGKDWRSGCRSMPT